MWGSSSLTRQQNNLPDSFTILNRGRSMGTFTKDTISKNEVLDMMAGGAEMQKMISELEDEPV